MKGIRYIRCIAVITFFPYALWCVTNTFTPFYDTALAVLVLNQIEPWILS